MQLQLIPILELSYKHRRFPLPTQATDTEYRLHRQQVLQACGFDMPFINLADQTYSYPIETLSDRNLAKILANTVKHKTLLEGGYALVDVIQGKTLISTRCCSDLNDASSWLNLLQQNTAHFWIGHPIVHCDIQAQNVIFHEYDHPEKPNLILPLHAVLSAVQALQTQLPTLKSRLLSVALQQGIPRRKILPLLSFSEI